MVIFSFYLFGIDNDFDGVEDDMDLCLETAMLDMVNVDGCSKTQIDTTKITLLQTFSYVRVDENSHLNNYNIALMLNRDSWLFYLGSGYFRYETQKELTDSRFLVQKSFLFAPNHYFKSAISAIFPTYTEDGNSIDYTAEFSYLFSYEDIGLELGYRYDMIEDDKTQDIQTPFIYLGYEHDKLHTFLGYSQDNEERKNFNLLLQYNYASSYIFNYSFTKTDNNFYDTMHTLGIGYNF